MVADTGARVGGTNDPVKDHGEVTDTRVGPLVGVDVGAAIQPAEWLSTGVVFKASHLAVGSPDAHGSDVSGALLGLYGGLLPAVHVPIGPREPR